VFLTGTIMTSLWLEQLTAEDRVSVKPHASPVLHALEYLLGQLDAKYLTTLREFGGVQSYPTGTRPAGTARRPGSQLPAAGQIVGLVLGATGARSGAGHA
jgi:hypothetical protein